MLSVPLRIIRFRPDHSLSRGDIPVFLVRRSRTHYKTPQATRTEIRCTVRGPGKEHLYSAAYQRHNFLCSGQNHAAKKAFVTKEISRNPSHFRDLLFLLDPKGGRGGGGVGGKQDGVKV
jgi:hypothetical protein